MTLRKAEFSLTADDAGLASDDVRIRPSIAARHGRLHSVVLERDATAQGMPNIAVSELNDVSDADWNDTAETVALGEILMFIPAGDEPGRVGAQDVFYAADYHDPDADPLIMSDQLRVELTGAVPGSVYTVTVHYETAGDYRF